MRQGYFAKHQMLYGFCVWRLVFCKIPLPHGNGYWIRKPDGNIAKTALNETHRTGEREGDLFRREGTELHVHYRAKV